MRHTSHQLAEPAPPQAVARQLAHRQIPPEFDGIPGLRNSQALRDWARATAELERAKQLQARPATIAELSHSVVHAYGRLQSLASRRR